MSDVINQAARLVAAINGTGHRLGSRETDLIAMAISETVRAREDFLFDALEAAGLYDPREMVKRGAVIRRNRFLAGVEQ
jgi:hypothetical protein